MERRAGRRPSLSTWILVGLVAGVATGLVLGEVAAPLSIVATAFIRLLQMAVLPYVVVSLTGALGRLERGEARTVARAGAGALAVAWTAALVLVAVMPLAFPDEPGGAFFSTTQVEPHRAFDFVGQYIPDNPFRSLADNVVPAVVIFSIALGIALMGVPGRAPLLADLAVLADALTRVNDFVVKLTPIGLFAIAASTTATLGVAEFERVQVYLVAFVALALLLAFGLLPALVACLTPLSYRDVVRAGRDPVLTALATGSLFVVLPQLAEQAKRLMAGVGAGDEESARTIDVVLPVSFNFPHGGKLLTLGFVAFAAWAGGQPLGLADRAALLGTGLLSVFGSVHVALPYLLDHFALPADMYQLFLAVSVINFRLATLVAAMHTFAVALLATATVSGRLHVGPRPLIRAAVVAGVTTAAVVGTLSAGLGRFAADAEPRASLVRERALLGPAVAATVHRTARPPLPAAPVDTPPVERLRTAGVLRVAYDPDMLPFSYFNDAGDLVGLDVDMAHALARDLGLPLDFVPLDRARLAADLDERRYDVAMAGIALGPETSAAVALSRPYLDLTMGFLVADRRRHDFDTRTAVQRLHAPRIGILGHGYYADKVARYLPGAELVRLASLRDFFARADDLDAVVHAVEIASAWSLIEPRYVAVVPQPDRLRVPISYAVRRGDAALRDLLDAWILLKRHDQTIDRLYRYWVLGSDEPVRRPRWSVVRDVLGWVD